MKNLFAVMLFLMPIVAISQDLKNVEKRISSTLKESYTVLNGTNIKDGLYLIQDRSGLPFARGVYKDNKRVGIWIFYDEAKKVTQRFDYNTSKLVYLDDKTDAVKTDFVVNAQKDAKVNPPVKIGGSTLGVLALYNPRDIPPRVLSEGTDIAITYTIDVSEAGKIGDVYANYSSNGITEKKKIYYNKDVIPFDFIPAKVDGIPVKSELLLSTLIKANIPNQTSAIRYQQPGIIGASRGSR